MIRLLAFQTVFCAASVMTLNAASTDQGKQEKLPNVPIPASHSPSSSTLPPNPASITPVSPTSMTLPSIPTGSITTHSTPEYACIEQESVTQGQIHIDGNLVHYTAQAGKFVLRSPEGAEKATLFYIAYTKIPHALQALQPPQISLPPASSSPSTSLQETSTLRRPITFCTNGGPGSSSVWLHMGLLGPLRIVLRDTEFTPPPYELTENHYSLLDQTDLVFIDPVSTGFSRAATGEPTTQFHGVKEDVQWMAEFIRLYLTRNNRWLSPKFFLGESYGTTRAAALLYHLHTRNYIDFNGVCLISMVLDFQNNQFDPSNDLPYLLALPTYTATAWYHKRLSKDLQGDFKKALEESETFALNGYALALLKGAALSPSEEEELVQKLARLTGLSPLYIRKSNFRIDNLHFAKELLRDQEKVIGRFDSRVKGIDTNVLAATMEFDPSMDAIFGAFTAGFNHYVRQTLKWNSDLPYNILVSVRPWNFDDATNRYLSTSQDLQELITRNPKLQVFVGSSYYDLATFYFGAHFTLQQMRLPPSLRSHIMSYSYEAGHMMYTHPPSLKKLREDLVAFYTRTLQQAEDAL